MTTGAVRRVPWFALGLSVVLKAVAVGLVLATPEQQRQNLTRVKRAVELE